MRCLFGDIVGLRLIGQVPVAGEDLAKNWVEGFLDSGRADMPAAQIELDNGNEPLDGVVDVGNWEKHLGVTHEAVEKASQLPYFGEQESGSSLLGYALQHASRLEDECWEHNSAKVGSGPQLRDNVHEHCAC